MENIIVQSPYPITPDSPNKIQDINLYDCPKCGGKGMKLKSCKPFAVEISEAMGLWLPEWEYELCASCNGKGKVEDLTPEYTMD